MVNKMEGQQKYDVFISYSRKDYVDDLKNVIPGNAVSIIKKALTEVGISYWFDEDGIYSGQNFVEKIVSNIEASKVFIFLSTENSNKSRWTCKEIACADELRKPIVPVRIDAAPYNRQVMFRISDLDYIEYYVDSERGLTDLINAINVHLEQIKAEENRWKEEENRKNEIERKKAETLKQQKELEEKRHQEEQQQLVATIEMTCTTLNNVESRLELDRAELIARTELVENLKVRDGLRVKISNGGPIHLRYQQECNELAAKNEELHHLVDSYKGKIENQQAEIRNTSVWYTKRRLIILCTLLLFVGLVIGNVRKAYLYNDIVKKMSYESSELRWNLNVAQDTISELRKRLEKSEEVIVGISEYAPLIVYDVEVKNENGQWGDSIYSKNSTFLYPRIKYFGIEKGTYKLYVKFYKPNGELSSNANSPKGYSSMREVSIFEGKNFSNVNYGWGGKTPGHWAVGDYRVQIWYDNRMLAEKTFKVY